MSPPLGPRPLPTSAAAPIPTVVAVLSEESIATLAQALFDKKWDIISLFVAAILALVVNPIPADEEEGLGDNAHPNAVAMVPVAANGGVQRPDVVPDGEGEHDGSVGRASGESHDTFFSI
ncbi:hypothetical protein BAUCODRAFT_147757 [Baudoinia panamericana UAMH 10762]|uniref:Uncharacterized protein n=1 Tax=Baudoinia panamericana (strain UAMH 10762) TaxID=717646 RepID=M2MM11_BAUPA|nr:uncharacterized protein BAUCODRAFT_147757 [Baudoinia panamericana UAMH 10762]EMC97716.1 hypothetical protein BAUCODRAFT_147757 [Baudoinia panamericana UAMH 10762]